MDKLRRLAPVLLLFVLSLALRAQSPGELRGVVLDASTSIGVPGAEISLLRTQRGGNADELGRFTIADLAPGKYTLKVSSPDYYPATAEIELEGGDSKSFEVHLLPHRVTQDRLDVTSEIVPFGSGNGQDSIGNRFTLSGHDVRNLSPVLGDDPLRAVQALPGVISSNDFEALFSLWGADPRRVGIFMDGVLLPQALHTFPGSGVNASASIFNPFLIDQLTLDTGVHSQQFAESSSGVLEVSSREGDHDFFHARAMANMAQSGVEGEGPVSRSANCSAIGAYRASYPGFLLKDRASDPSLAVDATDLQGMVSCHPAAAHTFTASFLSNSTALNRSNIIQKLMPTDLMKGNQQLLFGLLGWLYAPSDKLVVSTKFASSNNSFSDRNAISDLYGDGSGSESALYSSVSWMWAPNTFLSAGGDARLMHQDGFTEQVYRSPMLIQPDIYAGREILSGGYVQQAWTSRHGRVHLLAGLRGEHSSYTGQTVWTPQGSLAFGLTPNTQLQASWGQYSQFPDLTILSAKTIGGAHLDALRSNQATVAIQRKLGPSTHLHLEFHNRQDRDLLSQPQLLPRMLAGQVFTPPAYPLYMNSTRAYGRGLDFYVQQALGHHVSGWLAYSFGDATETDSYIGASYPSKFDQRHTVTAYGNYAFRPTLDFAAHWSYGSGLPLPGYFTVRNGTDYLASELNQTRLPIYQRLDVRLSKKWNYEKLRFRFFGEVMNVTDHDNQTFVNFDAFSQKSGRSILGITSILPIFPSAGILVEY